MKSVVAAVIFLGSILGSLSSFAQSEKPTVFDQIINKKVIQCESSFSLKPFVRLASGSEEELETNKVLASQITLFLKTSELIPHTKISGTKKECVQMAEGILVGSLVRRIVDGIAVGIEEGLEKAAGNIGKK